MLQKGSNGYWDLSFQNTLNPDNSLNTNIIISLFGSGVPRNTTTDNDLLNITTGSTLNLFLDEPIGSSLLDFLRENKVNDENLDTINDISQQALQWLIDTDTVSDVRVNSESQGNLVKLYITLDINNEQQNKEVVINTQNGDFNVK
jgi:phage gp46-like protein